jgi:hypothetical protein
MLEVPEAGNGFVRSSRNKTSFKLDVALRCEVTLTESPSKSYYARVQA